MQAIICGMDKQQGPTVKHREVYSEWALMEKNMKKNVYVDNWIALLFTRN